MAFGKVQQFTKINEVLLASADSSDSSIEEAHAELNLGVVSIGADCLQHALFTSAV